jgi:hypothetical protein
MREHTAGPFFKELDLDSRVSSPSWLVKSATELYKDEPAIVCYVRTMTRPVGPRGGYHATIRTKDEAEALSDLVCLAPALLRIIRMAASEFNTQEDWDIIRGLAGDALSRYEFGEETYDYEKLDALLESTGR